MNAQPETSSVDQFEFACMKISAISKLRSSTSFRQLSLLVGTLLLFNVAVLRAAEDREAITREDRQIAEAAGPWVYNDLEKGFEL